MEELREQIIAVALDRAFLLDPLPTDEFAFKRRVEEGRGRLTLIANEVARLAATILLEYAAAARKIKDTKNAPDATADAAQQLQRLMPKTFLHRHAVGPAAALCPLPEGHHRCGWTNTAPTRPATPPAWPSCARRSSATGAWWPSAKAWWMSACRNSAGCWKNCA